MTRSQKPTARSPIGEALKWTTEEWTTMLAWLDFCLTKRSKHGKFEDTIEKHMNSKWPDRGFNRAKIDRKLRLIWVTKGYEASKKGDIFRLGSQCLDIMTFSEEELSEFSRARVALGLPAVSESRDGNSGWRDRNNSNEVEVVIERRKRKMESEILDSCSHGEESLRSKKPRNSISNDRRAPENVLASKDQTIAGLQARVMRLEAEERQVTNLLQQYQVQELKVNSLMKELEQLSRRVSNCSNKIKTHITSHRSAGTWDISDSSSVKLTFAKYEKQLHTLRQERDTCRRLSSSKMPVYKTEDELVEGLRNIQDKIKRLFQQELGWMDLAERFQPSEKLESLLWKVFIPMRRGKTSIRQELEAIVPARPNNLLTALVAAAACGWVFESDFPNSDYYKSSLLDMYRFKLASQQDGLLRLRNLDYDAYDTIVKEPFTQDFRIRLRAEELTTDLFALLAPLIGACHSDLDDPTAILVNERDACIGVFSDCLSLKADSILIPDVVYELRMPPVEDLKFGSSIECEDRMGAPVAATTSDAKSNVLLCTFPGLWAHRARNGSGAGDWKDGPIAHVLVQLRNFRKLDDEENKSAIMIKEALVVCRG